MLPGLLGCDQRSSDAGIGVARQRADVRVRSLSSAGRAAVDATRAGSMPAARVRAQPWNRLAISRRQPRMGAQRLADQIGAGGYAAVPEKGRPPAGRRRPRRRRAPSRRAPWRPPSSDADRRWPRIPAAPDDPVGSEADNVATIAVQVGARPSIPAVPAAAGESPESPAMPARISANFLGEHDPGDLDPLGPRAGVTMTFGCPWPRHGRADRCPRDSRATRTPAPRWLVGPAVGQSARDSTSLGSGPSQSRRRTRHCRPVVEERAHLSRKVSDHRDATRSAGAVCCQDQVHAAPGRCRRCARR